MTKTSPAKLIINPEGSGSAKEEKKEKKAKNEKKQKNFNKFGYYLAWLGFLSLVGSSLFKLIKAMDQPQKDDYYK
jgi:hypothetical protein